MPTNERKARMRKPRSPLRRTFVGIVAAGAIGVTGAAATGVDAPRVFAQGTAEQQEVSPAFKIESAEVLEVNLDDSEQEFVRFTFTQDIQELPDDASALSLRGYDPQQVAEAVSVRLDEDDNSSLIVGFEPGTDVEMYTIAVAESGAVVDDEGNGNVQDASEVNGVDPNEGLTTRPELADVEVDESRNRIDYIFDEQLDEDAEMEDERLGFYTEDGDRRTGNIVSIEDERVTVSFDAEDDGSDDNRSDDNDEDNDDDRSDSDNDDNESGNDNDDNESGNDNDDNESGNDNDDNESGNANDDNESGNDNDDNESGNDNDDNESGNDNDDNRPDNDNDDNESEDFGGDIGDIGASDVDDAVRFFAEAGAVMDRQGSESVPSPEGGDTAAPDLTGLEPVGDTETQFDFQFDEEIGDPKPGRFAVYTVDGTRYEANRAEILDEDVVRVTIEEVENFTDKLALGVADDGAVSALGEGVNNDDEDSDDNRDEDSDDNRDEDSDDNRDEDSGDNRDEDSGDNRDEDSGDNRDEDSGDNRDEDSDDNRDRGEDRTDSTLGAGAIGDEEVITAGETAGPDVTSVEIMDVDAGEVRYRFDEPVDDDRRPESQKFLAITDSGTVVSADAVIEVNDEDEEQGFVTVTFDETAVESAAAFSIDAGAVEGLQGDRNPRNTLEAGAAPDEDGDSEDDESDG
jgi:hypothetical protein